MLKVKMLVGMASADWVHNPGDEVEVKEDVAEAWIENGIARAVTEETKKAKRKPAKGSDE